MPLDSRWKIDIPACSLQQWIFEKAVGPLASGDKPVLIDADNPDTHYLTMADFRQLAKRVALGLLDAGLQKGDRVLLFSGNNLYFPAIFLGILMAGGVFTGANPSYVARELAHQLRDSGARFMVFADTSMQVALEAAQEVRLPRSRLYVLDHGDIKARRGVASRSPVNGVQHWTSLVPEGGKARAEGWAWAEPAEPAETTCCLNYSSGTTGGPKGVEIAHAAYVANCDSVRHVTELDPQWPELKKTQRVLGFLPLYHAYGQTYFVANYPQMRVPVYIMKAFDLEKMLRHVQSFSITHLVCVPPIVTLLAKHPLVRQYDLSSIRSIGSGAAPLAHEVAAEAQRLWPAEKQVTVRQGWGMTEVTCTCLGWDAEEARRGSYSGAVGELMPNCRARIMALDGKTEITEGGEAGELWVAGPILMKGYWKNDRATAETIVVDNQGTRWMRTGDIAYVEKYQPAGLFHVVDRLKELIKVKGNQVAPAELEAVLLEREDVLDAAVIGVTIQGEEVPRAYIVKSAKAETTGQQIAKWMEGKVAYFKRLRGGVAFIDAIPKNPSGKIIRKQLRERAANEVGDRKPTAARLA